MHLFTTIPQSRHEAGVHRNVHLLTAIAQSRREAADQHGVHSSTTISQSRREAKVQHGVYSSTTISQSRREAGVQHVQASRTEVGSYEGLHTKRVCVPCSNGSVTHKTIILQQVSHFILTLKRPQPLFVCHSISTPGALVVNLGGSGLCERWFWFSP